MSLTASRRMRSKVPAMGRKEPFRLPPMPATAADYPAVDRFLGSIFSPCGKRECSPSEFKASTEDPFHEMQDRLVLKCGSRLLGHALTTRRTLHFGPIHLPAAGLHWLGIEQAFRSAGLGVRLLSSADDVMVGQGALIGLIRTKIPRFFRRAGWAICGRHSRCQAGVHDIIAAMIAEGFRPGRRRGCRRRSCEDILRGARRKTLHIRCWRRMEIPALLRIYNQNTQNMYGPLERTESYWKWLVERRGYDRLYVALDGPDLFELDEKRTPIVGYAAIRGNQILELMVDPGGKTEFGHYQAAIELLARACDDCIEEGYNCISYHGHPQDRLHDIFTSAGGVHCCETCEGGEVLMARLLRPNRVLRLMAPLFCARLQAACGGDFTKASLPGRLSLNVDGKRYAILIGRKGVAVQTGRAARIESANRAKLNGADFTRLVLGQFDWEAPPGENSLVASKSSTARLMQFLFPPLPLWRPPFDDATAR